MAILATMDSITVLLLLVLLASTLVIVGGWLLGARMVLPYMKPMEGRGSAREELHREFIKMYLGISRSISELSTTLQDVRKNLSLTRDAEMKGLVFDWKTPLESLDRRYADLALDMRMLEFWLNATDEYILNSDNVERIIRQYRADFERRSDIRPELAAGIKTSPKNVNIWLAQEIARTNLITSGLSEDSYENYIDVSGRVLKSLDNLQASLTSEAKPIQQQLRIS